MLPFTRNVPSGLSTFSPPNLQQRGPIRDRLAQTWNSQDQNIMRRQLVGVDQSQIEFCAQAATGRPLLYASTEFVEKLERFRGNDEILNTALDAAARTDTLIHPLPNQNSVGFSFLRNGITYQAKLDYIPERFNHTTNGTETTQGKITGIYIEGPDVTDEERQRVRGQETEASSSNKARTHPIPNESRLFLKTHSNLRTPPYRSALAGTTANVFAVISGKAPLYMLASHKPGIRELLAKQNVSTDEIYVALSHQMPLRSVFSAGVMMQNPAKLERCEFDNFVQFLAGKQKTLPECLNDLKTFGEMRQEYVNGGVSPATTTFLDELREACFHLPLQTLAANIGPNRLDGGSDAYNQALSDMLTDAGRLEEIAAMKGVSIVSLIADKDEARFAAFVEEIGTTHATDAGIRSVLDRLYVGHMTK